MSAASLTRYVQLAWFSQPKHERAIYRQIRKLRPAKIVELGLGDGTRASRMIRAAMRFSDIEVSYTGIDMFESNSDGGPKIGLKSAYRMLSQLGAKSRLLPGDPSSALATAANSLVDTDLIVISSSVNQESLQNAWCFVPRMLQTSTLILHQEVRDGGYRTVGAAALEQLSLAASRSRRAA